MGAGGDIDEVAVTPGQVVSGSASDDPTRPSLRRGASSRLATEVVGVAVSLVSAVIVARLLGPAGKGLFSTLWLLASFFTTLFMIGLGESAVVMVRRRGIAKHYAITASIAAAAALGLLGGTAFVVTTGIFVGTSPPSSTLTILVTGLAVAINVPAVTVSALHLIDEYVVRTSVVVGASMALSTTVLAVALTVFDGGVTAALGASACGSVLTLAAGLHKLRDQLKPASLGRIAAYFRSAVRMGAGFQISALLIQATNRVDLLLVYRLRSPAEAGTYSISLTIGALVILMPWAISYATFPRIARLEPAAANALLSRIVRTSLAGATASAMAMAAVTPFAVPLVFGSAFSPAVGPGLVLLLAGIVASCQLILCRGIAARGDTRPLIVSYVTNLVVMVGLDLVLIPRYGGMGAAGAYVCSAIAGLGVVLAFYCRGGGPILDLRPRMADLTGLLSLVPGRARSSPK